MVRTDVCLDEREWFSIEVGRQENSVWTKIADCVEA